MSGMLIKPLFDSQGRSNRPALVDTMELEEGQLERQKHPVGEPSREIDREAG